MCSFIAYCVTEYKTVFRGLIFLQFLFLPPTAPYKNARPIYRGYLLFVVNTKYISSSAVKKISIFHECVARVKMLIFSPHKMKYIWYLPKKSKFSLYFILNGNTEITTLLFTWSFLVRFDFCSVFIGYNIGCKRR